MMTKTTRIRVLSYNIHKGYGPTHLNFVLKKLKPAIREVMPDLVLLQEVLGHHEEVKHKMDDWPSSAQFEYLADEIWPHYSYGKNSVYSKGHHGNAILSKFPIIYSENHDVSLSRYERRGILHASIEIPAIKIPIQLHVLCVHLGLFENDRSKQIQTLCKRVLSHVPKECPVIIGGDFNDWRQRASHHLKKELNLVESFLSHHGAHARTFPSWLPVFKLDRMYSRGLSPVSATLIEGKKWSDLSDHLPILGEFDLSQ